MMDKNIDEKDFGDIKNGENKNNPEEVTTPQDKSKPKSIWETAREINALEKKEQNHKEYEKAHVIMKEQSREREQYSKGLYNDKLELLKMKQGLADEQEETVEEEKHYTFWQKVGNFFYHNKWWLGIASFCFIIAVFLIIDWLTTERSDVTILLLSDNYELYSQYENIEDYFEEFIDDYNNDGKVIAEVYYIPTGGDSATDYQEQMSNSTKLMAEFQSESDLIVIADSRSDDAIEPKSTLANLEDYISDNDNISSYGFSLSNTDFADKISYSGEISDDLYLGIRKVKTGASYEDKMKENFDELLPVVTAIINDLSE